MKHDLARARNETLVRRISEGELMVDLAEEYGLVPQYVALLAKKAGVKPTRGGGARSRKLAIVNELYSLGISNRQARLALGVSPGTMSAYSKALGVKFPNDNRESSVEGKKRASRMAAMYRAGMTLEQIGAKHGITRERVRQLMAKYEGMNHSGGGQHVKAVAKRQQSKAAKDARYLSKYGCTFTQYVEVRQIGRDMRKSGFGTYQTPLQAFANQRNNAKARGIGWNLTFWEWWTAWQDSGKWNERGLRRDGYVMSRFMDQGDYRLGNIYIGTLAENSSVQPNNPYRKDHPDYQKAMAAKMARRSVRERNDPRLSSHSKYRDLPRGVTMNKVTGRYQAQASIRGKNTYLGTFGTADEAHSAYLRATGQQVSTAHKISEAA